MLFVVYIKPQKAYFNTFGDLSACMLAAFLMREDAQDFMDQHTIHNDSLAIAEADNVWEEWTAIKNQMQAKEAA